MGSRRRNVVAGRGLFGEGRWAAIGGPGDDVGADQSHHLGAAATRYHHDDSRGRTHPAR